MANMGKNLIEQYKQSIIYNIPMRIETPFTLKNPSTYYIKKIIQNLQNSTAIGFDNIPISIIKLNKEYLAPHIKQIN